MTYYYFVAILNICCMYVPHTNMHKNALRYVDNDENRKFLNPPHMFLAKYHFQPPTARYDYHFKAFNNNYSHLHVTILMQTFSVN